MGSLFDVKTRNELADVLNIPRRHLTYILYIQRPDNCYTTFEIPKSPVVLGLFLHHHPR